MFLTMPSILPAKRLPILMSIFACVLAGLCVVSFPAPASAAAANAAAKAVTGYSGLPVPRFVNLKGDTTNGRVGPSLDYPVRYVFNRKGLPVRVVAETPDNVWRKVEDHEGETMWIHQSQLVSSGTVLVLEDGLTLHAQPTGESLARARLQRGVLARIDRCEQGWCQLTVDGFRGWAPQAGLWGVE